MLSGTVRPAGRTIPGTGAIGYTFDAGAGAGAGPGAGAGAGGGNEGVAVGLAGQAVVGGAARDDALAADGRVGDGVAGLLGGGSQAGRYLDEERNARTPGRKGARKMTNAVRPCIAVSLGTGFREVAPY